jgi:hypothetical protein
MSFLATRSWLFIAGLQTILLQSVTQGAICNPGLSIARSFPI